MPPSVSISVLQVGCGDCFDDGEVYPARGDSSSSSDETQDSITFLPMHPPAVPHDENILESHISNPYESTLTQLVDVKEKFAFYETQCNL